VLNLLSITVFTQHVIINWAFISRPFSMRTIEAECWKHSVLDAEALIGEGGFGTFCCRTEWTVLAFSPAFQAKILGTLCIRPVYSDFSFHRYSSFIGFSECSGLRSEQPDANFENPRVLESRTTSTCLEIWLNQRLLWKVCWKSSHCYVYNYINYNV